MTLSPQVAASTSLTTCPGFPGFCSEAFPGTSCQVPPTTRRDYHPPGGLRGGTPQCASLSGETLQ